MPDTTPSTSAHVPHRLAILHRRALRRCEAMATLDTDDARFHYHRVEYDGIMHAIAGESSTAPATLPDGLEVDYRHTPAMGEISGFGGQYEETCQTMLAGGVRWLHEHWEWDGEAGPVDDAIESAARELGRGGSTGVMHTVVRGRLTHIAENGWPAYVAMCEDAQRERQGVSNERPSNH